MSYPGIPITTPTSSSWAGWDSNANMNGNNFISQATSTVSSNATITLTAASNKVQITTGSSNTTFKFPAVSGLTTNTEFTFINNNSSGIITLQSSGSNTIATLNPGQTMTSYSVLTSGTGVTTWRSDTSGFITGTGVQSIATGTETELTATYWNGTSTTNGQITFSAGRFTATLAGIYAVSAGMSFGGNATGLRAISILTNGSASNRIGYESKNAVTTDRTGLSCSGAYLLNSGDYVSVFVYQTSGGNLNSDTAINGIFSIVKIGGY